MEVEAVPVEAGLLAAAVSVAAETGAAVAAVAAVDRGAAVAAVAAADAHTSSSSTKL